MPLAVEFKDAQVKQLSACEAALALYKKQPEQALRLLLSSSREGDPVVRIRVAECLMEIGTDRAVIGLLGLVDDPHTQVRVTAIGALGVIRAQGVRDKLMGILRTDPEMMVRIIAARTLGKLGSRVGLGMILKLLDDENEYFRRLAVMALRDIIGQAFSPTEEGIRSAKRYLEMNKSKFF
jgi:hypothetical protein